MNPLEQSTKDIDKYFISLDNIYPKAYKKIYKIKKFYYKNIKNLNINTKNYLNEFYLNCNKVVFFL